MKNFLIKELDQELELESFNYNVEGFVYKAKNKKIKEIRIINPEIISGLIMHNFNMKFKRILSLIMTNDDESDSDDQLKLALDELARLKSVIDSKYAQFLKKKELEKIHKKIMMTKKDIQLKVVDKKIKKEEKEHVVEKHKGR